MNIPQWKKREKIMVKNIKTTILNQKEWVIASLRSKIGRAIS